MKFFTRIISSAAFIASLFFIAIAVFYLHYGDTYIRAWSYPDALIAPIMALGSFVAGSTFLGGGAVAFPALTKILSADPITAKNFSLAIQSIGMTAASIYILLRIKKLPWPFLLYYIPAASVGLLLSVRFLEKYITGNDLRIGFSLFVLIFLLIYLWAYSSKVKHYIDLGALSLFDKHIIVKAGLIGGVLAGLLGSGADLVAFCILGLYFRLDIKLATQTSVIIMAFVSIFGVIIQGGVFQQFNHKVYTLWLLAAPVVMIGAPVGAYFCRRATTTGLLIFISLIVLLELSSTLLLVPLKLNRLPFYLLLVTISAILLVVLRRISNRKLHKSQHTLKEASIRPR